MSVSIFYRFERAHDDLGAKYATLTFKQGLNNFRMICSWSHIWSHYTDRLRGDLEVNQK